MYRIDYEADTEICIYRLKIFTARKIIIIVRAVLHYLVAVTSDFVNVVTKITRWTQRIGILCHVAYIDEAVAYPSKIGNVSETIFQVKEVPYWPDPANTSVIYGQIYMYYLVFTKQGSMNIEYTLLIATETKLL